MSNELRELYRSKTSVIGSYNNLLIVFSGQSPSRGDMDAMRLHSAAMSDRWSSGIALLLCIRPGVRPPDPETRDKILKYLRAVAPSTRAMAYVILGQGFIAAALRSVVAAIILGARATFPTKVFSDLDAGARWLATHVDGVDGVHFDRQAFMVRASTFIDSQPPPSGASTKRV